MGARFQYMRRALTDEKITGWANRDDVDAMQMEYRRALARLAYPTYKTGTWNYDDGSRIEAQVWRDVLGERAKATIFAPELTGDTVYYCLATSGLYSVANFLSGDIFLPEPADEGTTESYAFLSAIDNGGFVVGDFAESDRFSQHFINELEGAPYRFPNSMVIKKAGLFTGEMKRVVQLLAGRNAEIPYGYQWAKTHGVFINKKTLDRWVIEIEQNGVKAWPLEMVRNYCEEGKTPVVDYLPVPVTDLDSVTGKIALCGPEYLEDAYLGGPLLGGYMSWAFSASGHEAQVVIAYPGFGPGGEYTKSFRYKLTFSSDTNGDPSGVTLSLEQSGFVYTRDVSKNVRAPALSGSCGPSHPLALFSTGLSEPPEDGVISFPLAVYYVGETEQVFTFNHKPQTVEDVYPATSHPTMDHADCISFIYDQEYIDVDLYTARQVSTGGSTITGIPWAETEIDNSWTTDEYWHTVFSLSASSGPGCCIESNRAFWGVYGSTHKLIKTTIRHPSRTKLYQFCLIFPWWEREAYIFQERWLDTREEPITKYTSTRRVFGTSWHDSLSDAGPTTWVYSNDAVACLPSSAVFKYLGNCDATDPAPPVSIDVLVPWQSSVHYNLSGPTTQCCEDDNIKFVYYTAEPSGISLDDSCDDEEIGPAIDSDEDGIKLAYNAAGSERIEDLPSEVNTLFVSGLNDDVGTCSLINSSPLWFGAWVDAFTGAGWTKHEGYGAKDQKFLMNADGYYPMLKNLPISSEFSGWFGTPFPQLMIFSGE